MLLGSLSYIYQSIFSWFKTKKKLCVFNVCFKFSEAQTKSHSSMWYRDAMASPSPYNTTNYPPHRPNQILNFSLGRLYCVVLFVSQWAPGFFPALAKRGGGGHTIVHPGT